MKRVLIYLIPLVAFFSFAQLSAQGILNNAAYIVMTGGSQIYVSGTGSVGNYLSQANGLITPSATGIITIEGNWTNNAGNTGFTADAGTVVLNGAGQTINGTASTTFYHLTLQGSGTKTLNVATATGGVVTTTGVLSLGSRPLDLNGYLLYVRNPAIAAITYSTGYVISETNVANNPSILRRAVNAGALSYVWPFGVAAGNQIPFTIGKAASPAGTIDVATRHTNASNNIPWATGVTQMYDPTLLQDGSDEAVVDRWWEVTPSFVFNASLTLSYLGSENTLTVPYNTGNLGWQYWDIAGAAWMPDNSSIGGSPAVLAGVGTVVAPSYPIFAWYTPIVLSSMSAPLPIELTSFDADCNGTGAFITWTTATETNNNFFTIERCDDGINFHDIGTVAGNGTTTQLHSYTFTDNVPVVSTTYYRLRQTDYNGQSEQFSIKTVEACSAGDVIDAWTSENYFDVSFSLTNAGAYTTCITDARGRLISSNEVAATEGANHFQYSNAGLAEGVYFINVSGEGKTFSKKVLIVR